MNVERGRHAMEARRWNRGPVGGRALRQAGIGIAAGMALALMLKGPIAAPASSAYAAVSAGGSIGQIAERLREGQYRVAMHCPLKHQRVTYHVKAEHPGNAQATLEWILPACKLAAMGQGQAADGGLTWFAGQFTCQGNSFKRRHNVHAVDLHRARERALSMAPGCRIETIDQTRCPALEPLCEREYEDFKAEAELSRVRLLR